MSLTPYGCRHRKCAFYSTHTESCDFYIYTGRRRPRDAHGDCTYDGSLDQIRRRSSLFNLGLFGEICGGADGREPSGRDENL